MKIVIIGMGMIGKNILDYLSEEGHTITIIDENKEKIERLIESYDVMGVVGNGACLDIQVEAKVPSADAVIVITNSDEVNIMACLVAKKLGAVNTIARVRNPAYRKQIEDMKEELGISMIVNPEKETADEIFNLVNLPSVVQIEHFAKGKVSLVEIEIEKGCLLIGETLYSVGRKLKTKVLICAVQRDDQVIIPSGEFLFEEGDKISFTANSKSLGDFLTEINLIKSPFKNIMVVGGSRIGYYLVDELSRKKYNVKLIEKNVIKAKEIAKSLPRVNVVLGDGTSHSLLTEEGVEAMDVFVALTSNDEENIIVSMFANSNNVKKSITMVRNDELLNIVNKLGVKNIVSPKHVVANRITSYIRALSNKKGSNVLTLYKLVNNKVEALEFAAKKKSSFYNVPLKDLKIKQDCLVACIIRNNEVIIPNGNCSIRQGDNVIVVTTHKNFDDLNNLFE